MTHVAGIEGPIPHRDAFKFSYTLWAALLCIYLEAMSGIALAYELYWRGDMLSLLPALIAFVAWSFLIVFNLVKWRWRRALSLVVAPFIAVALVSMLSYLGLNSDKLRFEYRKSDLLKDVAESATAHGHPVLINWGWGDMGGGFGGASTEIGLVYDETDQIMSPPSTWSAEFRNRLFDQSPREPGRDYNQLGGRIPPNDYTTEPDIRKLGDHFYLVSQTVG
ncbi:MULTISPECIES: hypothetical protein [Rhizobium]|uniref:hypothetical protein n=1 Tax=Rhizobium TaxID=379 RepID=UPI00026ECBA5|nr:MULTISPECIES: hypothetical protein [Rhizobium]OCJ25534.1 hypothetical protein A6U88_03530 [Agrobacterium sp. B131/95]EJK87295.1 hypothetical protein PMI03_01306 [Rhizobium sp. AP16]MDJ1632210.1 hypothetical protein [Rhizobium rhizogenes]NTG73533.1 hypothetical protein [Rhizobium rhizogenes]NTI41397.1 hypothetical protein [Rhizobium rhizogenes]